MKGSILALVLGALAFGAAGAAGHGGTTPRGPLLAIWSDRGGTREVYTVSLDGRATRKLVYGPRVEIDAVSPRGQWVTYYNKGYWIARLDGRSARRLPGDLDEVDWAPDDHAFALTDVEGGPLRVMAPPGKRLAGFPLSVDGVGGWSPDARLVGFSPYDDLSVIDSVRLDGSDRHTLFGTPTKSAQNARWSPDGTKVAYSLGLFDAEDYDGRYADLYVANADGSGRVAVAHGEDVESNPAWSPDGRWLAYERVIGRGDDTDQIWIVRADGTERRRLTSGSFDTTPTWTPDGSTVVFDRWLNENASTLFRIGVDGTGLRKLGSKAGVETASFAPNGSRFVAEVWKNDDSGIGLFGPKGKLLRMLTPIDSDWTPIYSPDGSSIAFSRAGSIAVMNADGSEMRLITDDSHESDQEPAWSGDRLSFDVWPTESALDVLDVRSGRTRTVARDADGDHVAWSRRRDAIAYTASEGDALYIRSLPAGRLLGTVKKGAISGVVWAADGRTVFFQAGSDTAPGTLYGFTRTGRQVLRINLRHSSDLSWSPNQRWAAVVEGRGQEHGDRLAVFDTHTRRLRVIARRAGIRKDSLTWDVEGGRIAFTVERTALDGDGDVFYINRAGGPLRQVTHAFPDGGDNTPLAWTRGMRPPAEPVPRVRNVQPDVLGRGGKVLALSATENRVAFAMGGPNAFCGRLHVRLIGAAADSFLSNPCAGGDTLTAVQANADLVAWVLLHGDTGAGDDDYYCLYAADASGSIRGINRRYGCDLRYVKCHVPMLGWGWDPLSLGGTGDLIAAGNVNFGYCPREEKRALPTVVRVEPGRATRLVYAGLKLRFLDADSGHLLLADGPRILVVYDSRGAMLRVLRLRAPVTAAMLDGSRVVLLSGRALGVRDLWSGRAVARMVIPRSLGRLTLDDAAGGLVAYTQGAVIHVVRFADHRDAPIWIHDLAQVGRVVLTPSGLVVGAQVSGRRRGGVVAFVPEAQLSDALARSARSR